MTSRACPDCASGSVHAGNPTGTEETIHGFQTYVARPEGTPKAIIVYIPDAFGWKFVNNRLLADDYARKGGYLVYIPEIMNGNAPTPNLLNIMDSIMAPSKSFFQKYLMTPVSVLHAAFIFVPFMIVCRESVVMPVVINFVKALRSDPETSNMKIGAAGFCFGGKHVFLLAHDDPSSRVKRVGSGSDEPQRLIDAAFTAHPSGLKMPNDIDQLAVPMCVAVGDVDMVWKIDSIKEAEKIMEKKSASDYEITIYPGAKHGFAVRSNPGDVKQKEMGDQAEVQALKWFGKWLG